MRNKKVRDQMSIFEDNAIKWYLWNIMVTVRGVFQGSPRPLHIQRFAERTPGAQDIVVLITITYYCDLVRIHRGILRGRKIQADSGGIHMQASLPRPPSLTKSVIKIPGSPKESRCSA